MEEVEDEVSAIDAQLDTKVLVGGSNVHFFRLKIQLLFGFRYWIAIVNLCLCT